MTTIEFALPRASNIRLELFNTLGQLVATLAHGQFAAGGHAITFDAAEYATGLYIYRLTSGDESLSRKMVLLK